MKSIVDCHDVLVWGTGQEELDQYKKDMEEEGFHVDVTLDTSEIVKQCNLIITVTPSKIPLISGDELLKGTHITAVGSDTVEKQELDASILEKADVVVADSIEQCMRRGEIYKAMEASAINKEKVN